MDFFEILSLQKENQGSSTGRNWLNSKGETLHSHSPVDGKLIGSVITTDQDCYNRVIQTAQEAFLYWRMMPAPARGEIIRQIGDQLREYKEPLGKLVSYEMGKSLQEGLGEVQEMIDVVDFAVGLSRQLHGLTMHSERPGHRMYEQWHPLGVVGVITAFNFPVAVWAWNALLAAVCGNATVWKPSPKTPLAAIAVQQLCNRIIVELGLPPIFTLLIDAGRDAGARLAADPRVSLVSFTGSSAVGRQIAQVA